MCICSIRSKVCKSQMYVSPWGRVRRTSGFCGTACNVQKLYRGFLSEAHLRIGRRGTDNIGSKVQYVFNQYAKIKNIWKHLGGKFFDNNNIFLLTIEILHFLSAFKTKLKIPDNFKLKILIGRYTWRVYTSLHLTMCVPIVCYIIHKLCWLGVW